MSEENTGLKQIVQDLVTELQSLREESQMIRDREEAFIQQLVSLIIRSSLAPYPLNHVKSLLKL